MDADELVAEGEVGRIVITDLYNRAMPMIDMIQEILAPAHT